MKMYGLLLACYVCLVAGTPSHPWSLISHDGITHGSYIKHYSAAWYDTAALREHRIRKRRDTSASGRPADASLNLRLHAFDRIFRMKLTRDTRLFHQDVVFQGSNGREIAFDPLHVYSGTLEDDEGSLVHGIVTKDGLFDGTIITGSDEIYIEPASRYAPLIYHRQDPKLREIDDLHYHTIAYRSVDVAIPHVNLYPCTSELLRKKTYNELRSNRTWTGYLGDTMRPLYQQLNESRSRAKPGFYPKDARKNDPMASSHNLELLDRLYRERYLRVLRKRISVDSRKTTCMLYLQADHTFFNHYKSEETCIEVMTRHVQKINIIYRHTDFNQDGQPDNISFMIKRVKVHGEDALIDPTYRFTGTYGVEEFLELFSEENYDAFCLSYMFTYRDFEKGTLGLAWTGDLKNAGGVCEKNGHYRGSMKSLNTGIITLLNYGKHVPPTVSHVTLAHEIGHNFGSPHDPDECSPGGEDGNFIMFARATSGDKRNNNRFSPCSLVSINPVLNTKARSTKGCFAEPQSAICGNGVVEEGEECDCGWEEDCNDPCCHPQRLHHAPYAVPCRLTDGAVCSPSQGPCCTPGCTLRNGNKCRDDNGCRNASFCDGHGPQCPPSVNKPNKTICNDEYVCYMGECTGSICLAYGLESCQCIAETGDPPTKSCELCCKLPGENQPCLSSFDWNSAPYDIPDMLSKPGTPCNDYNGYCDVFQKCREVDPSGPLATLRRLLLSNATLANFQRWLIDRWYFVALMLLTLLFILISLTRLFSKRQTNHLNVHVPLENIPSQIPKGKEDTANKTIREKLSSMNVVLIKKRLIETMKSIVSLGRKRDKSSSDTTLFMRISHLFNRHFANSNQYLEKQKLNEELGKSDDDKCWEDETNEHKLLKRNKEVKKGGGRTREDLSKKKLWRKMTMFFFENSRVQSSGERVNTSEVEGEWENKKVERLCDMSTVVCACKINDGCQTESLMTPETPETPGEAENRIHTSDLTVLLPKS